MKNFILWVAALIVCTCTTALAASDPFTDGRANVETLLAKPGAKDLLHRLMQNIDTSLECFAVGTKALGAYATNQLPHENAVAFGIVLWLSSYAATDFQTEMGIGNDTFLDLSTAASMRFETNPGHIVPKCLNITNQFVVEVTSLAAS